MQKVPRGRRPDVKGGMLHMASIQGWAKAEEVPQQSEEERWAGRDCAVGISGWEQVPTVLTGLGSHTHIGNQAWKLV